MIHEISITDLDNDVLSIILAYGFTADVMRVSKQWLAIIQSIPETARQSRVNSMVYPGANVRQIPASMYDLLTFEHKVMIPNLYIAGTTNIIVCKYKHPIPWRMIITHDPNALITREYISFIAKEFHIRGYNACYFAYMFNTYEQYRRHIIDMKPSLTDYFNSIIISNKIDPSIDLGLTIWYCVKDQRKVMKNITRDTNTLINRPHKIDNMSLLHNQ